MPEGRGWAVRRGPFTFTRARIAQVGSIVAVGIVGALLPYLFLVYENYASEVVRETHSLWPAARLLGLLNIVYLPSAADDPDQLQRGVDLMNLGAHAHQVGLVIAVLTAWGLFMDEINKFLWWPLHLAGWILGLGTVALIVGWLLLRAVEVDVQIFAGWVPLLAAGILALVFTFRSRSRIDTYRGA